MRYAVEGDYLCIRIPVDAITSQAVVQAFGPVKVVDKAALAMALGRELCECEDTGEDFYLNRSLDAALVRVIESADPSLEFDETKK